MTGSPPRMLLEREGELARLRTLLHQATDREGGSLVIQAGPGLGKSRLLREASDTLSPGAMSTLSFTCGELERELPWSGAVGLLSGAANGAVDVAVAGGGDSAEHFSIVHALFRITAELAGRRPLALLLDDAHWADPHTLRFLIYLQRRLHRLPLALILATRPVTDGEVADLLTRLACGPSAQLRPLSSPAVATLVREQLGGDTSDAMCDRCAELTAGNPFYLRELLRSLQAGELGDVTGAEPLPSAVPGSIHRSVQVRLGRLPGPGAPKFLRAVSVLGDGSTLRQASALAGLTDAEGAESADALSAVELLAGGEPLRFAHPLVRAAVLTDIPAARRARMHAEAAGILSADGRGADVVAAHLLHVPMAGSAETVAGLRAGAAVARRRAAPETAARLLHRALQEPPAPEHRGELLVELARAEMVMGAPEAVLHLSEAIELLSGRRRAEALLDLGWAEHHAGRFGDAAAAFRRGLELVGPGDGPLASELEAGYLGAASLDAERAVDARVRIDAIRAAPPEQQGRAERGLLAQVLFGMTMRSAPHQEVIALAERIWADGRLLDQEGAESQTAWHVVGALSWSDAYAPALRVTEALADAAVRAGSVLPQARAAYARSWPYLWMGRVADSAAAARTAAELWYGGLETYLPAAVYWGVRAELEGGRPQEAARLLALAEPLDRWDATGMAGFIASAQGYLAADAGQPTLALAHHRRCGQNMDELQIQNPAVMPWRSDAALAAALAGEHRDARHLAAQELELARTFGAPRAIGLALRVLGTVTGGQAGAECLSQAVEVLTGSGAELELAHAWIELGASIRRTGRRGAARAALSQGLGLATAAGAATLAARGRTELQATGLRDRSPSEQGVDSLTASQRRVAELAADGHSNRHIANRLQVSVKAVEWHLHQTYRRLDITGRRQLRAALAGEEWS